MRRLPFQRINKSLETIRSRTGLDDERWWGDEACKLLHRFITQDELPEDAEALEFAISAGEALI